MPSTFLISLISQNPRNQEGIPRCLCRTWYIISGYARVGLVGGIDGGPGSLIIRRVPFRFSQPVAEPFHGMHPHALSHGQYEAPSGVSISTYWPASLTLSTRYRYPAAATPTAAAAVEPKPESEPEPAAAPFSVSASKSGQTPEVPGLVASCPEHESGRFLDCR